MKRPFSERDHLPETIDSVDGVRELDARIIARMGDNGYRLMAQAGAAAFAELRHRWPAVAHICVLAGSGNNGGDGWVVARLAKEHGLEVTLLTLGELSKQSDSARQAREEAEAAGVCAEPFNGVLPESVGLIVDGILGTGLSATVTGEYADAIKAANRHKAPVLALDIPSGLQASTGAVLGSAIDASATVTFIGVKPGLLTCDGPDVTGDVVYAALDLKEAERDVVDPQAERISWHLLNCNGSMLAPRRGNTNKGNHGHALLIGGDVGFGGAIAMATDACARSGAGLTSCVTQPENVSIVLARRPECMARGVVSGLEIQGLLEKATVIGCGPGLGRSSWAELLLQQVLLSDLPCVLDADALNIIASPGWHADFSERDAIMTPHPGEAARLLGVTVADIQADRLSHATVLAEKYRAVVVLKGQGTVIAAPGNRLAICTDGNPGMGSGGMGDVLTGVLTALLAQGLSTWDAARLGVCVHSAAADLAAEQGMRGLLATDLMPYIRELVN